LMGTHSSCPPHCIHLGSKKEKGGKMLPKKRGKGGKKKRGTKRPQRGGFAIPDVSNQRLWKKLKKGSKKKNRKKKRREPPAMTFLLRAPHPQLWMGKRTQGEKGEGNKPVRALPSTQPSTEKGNGRIREKEGRGRGKRSDRAANFH